MSLVNARNMIRGSLAVASAAVGFATVVGTAAAAPIVQEPTAPVAGAAASTGSSTGSFALDDVLHGCTLFFQAYNPATNSCVSTGTSL
ncbi:hypothetical protein [Nocardia sp. CDC160]|uniref:hypothetical protein n=1 Tax=Nocardia sp. CDC160 TaxID=3112166 RepID=UPI002DBC7A7A|nr:hypothetical protein [Nocardia sp. CDC160]MEC3918389.1 hypothetical protein [Nocardia sp. CDC160]